VTALTENAMNILKNLLSNVTEQAEGSFTGVENKKSDEKNAFEMIASYLE
jgi:hypothetical protein